MTHIRLLIAAVRSAFPPNRVVALLTPLAAAVAATSAAWIANHAPLVADQVGKDQITAIFVAVVASVTAVAYKWLDGWSRYEDRVSLDELASRDAPGPALPPDAVEDEDYPSEYPEEPGFLTNGPRRLGE